MRIVVFGDTPGAFQLLRLNRIHDIVAIVHSSSELHPLNPHNIPSLHSIPVLTHYKKSDTRYASLINTLTSLAPDYFLINSYSQILPSSLLAIPTFGTLNLHGSFLPFNRGCNPLQWALINNQNFCGLTLHSVNTGIDSGPILAQRLIPISLSDTWLTLHSLITHYSNTIWLDTLNNLPVDVFPIPNPAQSASYGPRRSPSDSHISASLPTIAIFNHIRALLPPLPHVCLTSSTHNPVPLTSFLTLSQVLHLKSILCQEVYTYTFLQPSFWPLDPLNLVSSIRKIIYSPSLQSYVPYLNSFNILSSPYDTLLVSLSYSTNLPPILAIIVYSNNPKSCKLNILVTHHADPKVHTLASNALFSLISCELAVEPSSISYQLTTI